jgi:hypothetical protein
VRVELLFWAGCPSHGKALLELQEVLRESGYDPEAVIVREVKTDEDAASEGFVGSPTIRIDGADVQPLEDEPAGLTCRIYHRRDGRISPTPDPADVREAVLAATATAAAPRDARQRAAGPSR